MAGVTRSYWSTAAYGVNKYGQVVGYAQNQSLQNRAVLYDDRTGASPFNPIVWPDGANSDTYYTTLSTPGFSSGYAYAINAFGTIIG